MPLLGPKGEAKRAVMVAVCCGPWLVREGFAGWFSGGTGEMEKKRCLKGLPYLNSVQCRRGIRSLLGPSDGARWGGWLPDDSRGAV